MSDTGSDTSFGTSLFTTTIRGNDDGTYRWERHAALDHGYSLSARPEAQQWCEAFSTNTVRFLAPSRAGDHRKVSWAVSGRTTLASLLYPAGVVGEDHNLEDIRQLFSALGSAKEQCPEYLELATTAEAPIPPASLIRLLKWFDNEWNVGASGSDREIFERIVGRRVFGKIKNAAQSLAGQFTSGQSATKIHGFFSMGNMVVESARPDRCEVLSGVDIVQGPPAFDTGTLLGELCEYYFSALSAGLPYEQYRELARAYLSGGDISPGIDHASALIIRIATHLLDYSSFVAPIPEFALYRDLFLEVIDNPLSWLYDE